MENFEIIAGTYEEYLLAYRFNSDEASLTQSFATHDHRGSLRSVAASGHYVASGASDDRIIIYDLKVRKEHCWLTHHQSPISCLCFTKDHSHLATGSVDGTLAIVRVGSWKVEKLWTKAHKGSAIVDIAMHSSGMLALTLGSDCTLRTWNLVKGRQAYIINLTTKSKDAKSLEKIVWAEDGVKFIIYGGIYTEIWSIEIGGSLKVIEHPTKVASCIWYSDEEILVGYEDGQMALIQIDTLKKKTLKAHDARVKAISRFLSWFVTASSNGEIKVWNMDLVELAKCSSGCRINCLTIAPLIDIKKEEAEDGEPEENTQENLKVKMRSTVVIEEDSDSNEEIVSSKKQIPNQKSKVVKTNATMRTDEFVIVETPQPKKKQKVAADAGQNNAKKKRKKKL